MRLATQFSLSAHKHCFSNPVQHGVDTMPYQCPEPRIQATLIVFTLVFGIGEHRPQWKYAHVKAQQYPRSYALGNGVTSSGPNVAVTKARLDVVSGHQCLKRWGLGVAKDLCFARDNFIAYCFCTQTAGMTLMSMGVPP